MKRMRKVLAGVLALCLLLALVPAADAAETPAGEFWVRDVMIPETPNRAVVWAMAEEDCLLLAALYDSQGKMLWSDVVSVTGSGEDQRIPVTIPADRPEGAVLDAFLLDPVTHTPLCEGTGFAALGGEGDYAIASLSCPHTIFTAKVSTREACKLHFQVLSEDGMTELYAGVENAAAGLELRNLSHWSSASLPDSYLIRAVLRDGEGRALCRPVTDRSNTASYREFAWMGEGDFPAEQVLDLMEKSDGNFAVLHAGVLNLTEDSGFNVLVSRENGVSTFTNADVALTELKAGDRLCFRDLDGQYATVKAAAVRVAGTTVTITEDPNVGLAEFYDVIKIDAALQAVAPESAVSLQGTEAGSLPADVFGITMGPQLSAQLNTPFGAVEAELRAGGDFRLHYDFKQNYLESRFQIAYVGQMDVTVGPNSDCKGVLPLMDLPMTGIPDLADVSLNLDVEYEVDCKGGLSIVSTVKQTMGYTYNSRDGGQAIKKTGVEQDEVTTEAAMAFDFDVSTGLKASLNASLLDDSGRVGLGAGAGIGAKGRLEVQSFPDLPVRDAYHACLLCMSGNAYGYAEVELAADFKITNRWKGTLMDLDLVRAELEVGNFYHSLANEMGSVHGGKPVFAWEEECPNRKYRTQVLTYSAENEEVTGCAVSIQTSLDQPVPSGASPLTVYLYPGAYRASAAIERLQAQEPFTVKDESVEVVLRVEKVDLRGTVTDAVTDKTLSGVSVTVEENGEVVDSVSTSVSGIYSTSLIPGTYTLTFSAEGYEPESRTVTLTEDTTLDVQLQPKAYTIRFSPGEGSGTMADGTVFHDQHYILPACGFTPPEGKVFKGWSVNGTEYPVGGVLSFVQSDKTVTAVWKDGTVYPVTVKVIGTDGKAVSGVAISGTGLPAAPHTGAGGTAAFELSAGTYTLSATTYVDKTKYTASQTVVVDGAEHVTLTLKNELVWEFDPETKVLEIYGDGPMPYYSDYSKIPWYRIQADEIRLYGVTTISRQAFAGRYLDRVILPEGLTRINWYAFQDTVIYEPLVLPDSLEIIEAQAFYEGALEISGLPAGLKEIGRQAFYGHPVYGLGNETLIIPGGIGVIETGAFFHCGVKDLVIEEGIVEIGSLAFSDCWRLESVTIPASVTEIGVEAFDCEGYFPDLDGNNTDPVLKDVYYAGTKAQWEAIEINPDGNEALFNATIHFESTGPEN